MNAIAGYSASRMAEVRIELFAVCHRISDCVSQVGSASATVDVVVHGEPAGTLGIIEIFSISIANFGIAQTSVTGLTQYSALGPHFGTMYTFLYGQPFRLEAVTFSGCSECEGSGGGYPWLGYPSPLVTQAGFAAPFYIYDLDLILVGLLGPDALDEEPVPEPGSVLRALLGVGLMIWLRGIRMKKLEPAVGIEPTTF